MEKSLQINGWYDLRAFGINMLTGEADRLNLRLLCDLTEQGAELLIDYFGLPSDVTLAEPANSAFEGEKTVGSIMVARGSLHQIATFAAFRANALAIVEMPGSFTIIFDAERLAQYEGLAERDRSVSILRNYGRNANAPHFGTRNIHAMTGRAI